MTASSMPVVPAPASSIRLTRNGVTKIPTKLEADAAQTAAGIFPRASDVNAMADCTVPGKAAKYSIPTQSCSPKRGLSSGCNDRINKGNKMKVQAKINRCKRQCKAPSIMARRDNLAPCKKNNKAIAEMVRRSKKYCPLAMSGQKGSQQHDANKNKREVIK